MTETQGIWPEPPLSPEPPPQPERPTLVERMGLAPSVYALIGLVATGFVYQIIGAVIIFLMYGLNPLEGHTTALRVITGVSELFLIFLPAVLLVRGLTRTPSAYFRLRWPGWKEILLPLIGIFSLQQMLQVYQVFQDRIPLPDDVQKLVDVFRDQFDAAMKQIAGASTPGEFLFVVFVVAIIPAIAEEFLFRGFFQRPVEEGTSPVRAIILTGILFGLFHLNPFLMVPLVSLGIYLGFVAWRANSLWVSIAAHFFNNFTACLGLYLEMKDDYVVAAGNAAEMSTGTLLFTFWFFGLIFIFTMLYFVRITRRPEPVPEPEPEPETTEDSDGPAAE
jgi:uncharacterized protein